MLFSFSERLETASRTLIDEKGLEAGIFIKQLIFCFWAFFGHGLISYHVFFIQVLPFLLDAHLTTVRHITHQMVEIKQCYSTTMFVKLISEPISMVIFKLIVVLRYQW